MCEKRSDHLHRDQGYAGLEKSLTEVVDIPDERGIIKSEERLDLRSFTPVRRIPIEATAYCEYAAAFSLPVFPADCQNQGNDNAES